MEPDAKMFKSNQIKLQIEKSVGSLIFRNPLHPGVAFLYTLGIEKQHRAVMS